ncbi:hypothetical protein SO802_010022 [Lithocarpus litseifolius]|uniref:MULE transposase domain-containing protein n=1 Tax=Lithocarpus litseifolius TaxID=425828 RepID=A0AAW2DD58_9ROSI
MYIRKEGRVPTMPFASGLKPLENDVDVMNMVMCIRGYNEVEVYVMFSDDYENACESDDDDMFAQYISSDEIASKVKGLPDETLCLRKEKQVDASGVNPSASMLIAFRADRDEDKWESETSASLVSSSDDETRRTYPQYHPPESFSDMHFELEMQLATKKDVMDAIKLYSIFKRVPVKFKKNDKIRVRLKCIDRCPFELCCGKMKDEDTWIVKKLNPEHNCGRRLRNRFASSNWLRKHLVDDVRNDPNVNMSVIKDQVVNNFKIHINRYQASRAKGRAKELVHGTFTEQYAQLGDYCKELLRSNPGSTTLISTNRPQPHLQPKFERLYVCLDACKRGFLAACKPFIGVDGCHLKGEYPGQILTAVGKDGNIGVYPIAFVVVEAETKDLWTWFMKRLLDDIGSLSDEGWTFMSDQQKGLTQMFDELMPSVDHRFCVRHLYNNFSKDHKGKLLKDRMWEAARATNMSEFQFEMGKIKKLNIKAWEWLGKEMSQHKVNQHPNVKEYIEVNQHLRLDPTKLQEVIVLEYQ